MIAELKAHLFFASKRIASCTLLEHQGYCNENYQLIVDGKKYIVRKLLRDDIDRALEWKVQGLAYELDITAEPLVFDEKQGFMAFAFLEGEHKHIVDKSDLKYIAITLQKLHSITIDVKPIQVEIGSKSKEITEAFKTIEKYPKEYVLCHNDLNPQNIFFSEDVKLIDWEYAGLNDRYFDLACVCAEFKLDAEMQEAFLDVYFKGESFVLEKLEAYKIIYAVLCEEWFNAST